MIKRRMTNANLQAKAAAKKAAKAPLRPLDQSLANEREQSTKVMENAVRVQARLRAALAENAYAPPRRDDLADRDIFEEIQRSLRGGHQVRLTGKAPTPVNKGVRGIAKNTSDRINQEEVERLRGGLPIGIVRRRIPVHLDDWKVIDIIDRARRQRGELEKTIWIPHWDRTGDHLKSFAWSMAIWENNGAVMTVNIAPAVVEAADRDGRGFAVHMRERLRRELNKASIKAGYAVPEFFFVVERTELGKPHLHGGITLPDLPPHRQAVRDALFYASHGRELGRKRTGREIDLQPYRTPAIWANYSAKWVRGSRARVDGSVFAATTRVRALGKDWYERMRFSGDLISGHEANLDLIPVG
jgi:hypothetical protein